MKFSIYVPDQLWEKARVARPDAPSPSQLVQDALQRLTNDSTEADRVPPDAAAEYAEVRERLLKEASAEFDRGYHAALKASSDLEWEDFEVLADFFKFDVKRWAVSWQESAERHDLGKLYPGEQAPSGKKVKCLMDALGDWAAPHELAEWEPTLTYAKGFTQAMRTIWSSVVKAAGHAADLGMQAASTGKEVSTDEVN